MNRIALKRFAWPTKYVLRSALISVVFRILALILIYFNILYQPKGTVALYNNHLLHVTTVMAFLFLLPPLISPLHRSRFNLLALISVEYLFVTALLCLTGAEASPFLLYSFTPVLTTALFLPRKFTYAVSGLTIISLVGSFFIYPHYSGFSVEFSLIQVSLYVVAVFLTASLPYLVNVNLRENLAAEHIRNERMRLSREIHDGIAQTLHALCWQVQILQHRQAQGIGQQKSDLAALETLAEKARRDILESLQVLRNVDYNPEDVSLKTMLQNSLERLKQENNINFHFSAEDESRDPDSRVKLEVSRIFQESLANIRKHSRAQTVWVDLKKTDDQGELIVVDDGCGFDSVALYRGDRSRIGHHGLLVMKERAQSVHGDLQIISRPDYGTEIMIRFPYN